MAERQVSETVNGASVIVGPIQHVIAGYPNVILGYLFGSQVQGNVGRLSDVDIALLLDKIDEPQTFRSDLRSSMAAAIDRERIDLVFLNKVPLELAFAIIAHGELIYERDTFERVEYEATIMSLYCDYLPVLRAQRADILNGEEYETRVQRYREALGRTERTLSALRSAEN
jgi:predicted nucleotidyltransferase